jgi:hypothetical protein
METIAEALTEAKRPDCRLQGGKFRAKPWKERHVRRSDGARRDMPQPAAHVEFL